MSEDRFLSLGDVAARLNVSEQTIRRWVKSGRLKAYKPGLEWRIAPEDLDEFLEMRSSPKPQASPSPEPSLNDELDEERRSTAFIKVLRAYFWDLRLRWKEQGDKPSPGQIRDALDLLQRLTDHGALEGSLTPREHSELQLLLNAADKLRPIAEELAAEGGTTPSRQMVDEVFGELDKQLEKVNR
jgi:excisionase family DNA binding protein